MSDGRDNARPLTVTLGAACGELVRDWAQAQGCTYRSGVEACIRAMLAAGVPTVLEPFGEPDNVRKGEYNT